MLQPRVKGVSTETTEYYQKAGKKHRQKLGQFYTPKEIINKCFDTIDLPKTAKVLEPTYGSGEFLDALLKRGFKDITGVEFDPVVYSQFKDKWEGRGVHTINGNYLLQEFPSKFDLVIGNPPYFMMEGENKPDAEYEKALKSQFGTALKGRRNIYVLATIKGIMDLNDGGILSFVIPTSLLTSPMFQAQRDWIHAHASIQRVEIHSERDAFSDANVEVMIFQVQRTSSPNDDFIVKKSGKVYFGTTKTTEAEGESQKVSSMCNFKTGPIDYAKYKDRMSATASDETAPVIYAENIVDGKLKLDKKLKGQRVQHLPIKSAPSLLVKAPFLIVARTIGSKNKLNVALVKEGEMYPENHTLYAKCQNEADLQTLYDVLTDDEYIRPILTATYGQVKSITTTLLNNLPLPS